MLYQILVMCMFHIDPKMDRFLCVNQMVDCSEKSSFNSCSEYWEPLIPVNEQVNKEIAINENDEF
jgi:hypothetical protein